MTKPIPFRAGDVCYLNSGSPKLTVDHVRQDGTVEVRWMGADGFAHDAFPAACLTRRGGWMLRYWRPTNAEVIPLAPKAVAL